jgi:hypothetical protein
MGEENMVGLSEQAANMVENLAVRIAERQSGKIAANDLMPYLPVSLAVIQSCLDDMVDQSAVLSDATQHVTEYQFVAYAETPPKKGPLRLPTCVACDCDLPAKGATFCPACFKQLKAELTKLADANGWPAEAVYEHEILYLAASREGLVHAEELAGRSRLTLRNMRKKLDTMSAAGHLQKVFDEKTGTVAYSFPAVAYPKANFRDNMAVIRSYPASAMEEVQIRLAQILFALGFEVLLVFAAAFLLRFPFPILMILLLVAAPITAILIWRHRTHTSDE